jgi:hypothetical protein
MDDGDGGVSFLVCIAEFVHVRHTDKGNLKNPLKNSQKNQEGNQISYSEEFSTDNPFSYN